MDHLLTEARNPSSNNLDELSPLELTRLMNAEDAKVIPAVAAEAEHIARAIEVTVERIRAGGRLVYIGAGTSGRLGVLDASECPPTFRTPPGMVVGIIAGGPPALTTAVEGAEDHPDFAERDLQAIDLGARDVLIGIASSGRTPYVVGALRYAREQGVFAIGLACVPDSDLKPVTDLMIVPLVGPEVLTGSTRLKAGTATKLVLNSISTGVMVRLGKTFGNLMVDLRATNSKLRARANRIVRQFTGQSKDAADTLLKACAWEVKTALVAHHAKVDAAKARARLRESGGQVREAMSRGGRAAAMAAIQAPRTLLLGIDGGGTHTTALLAEVASKEPGRWRALGRGHGGPSNMQAVGLEPATQAIDAAVTGAFASAGIPRCTVIAACLGLAGAGRTEEQALISRWASEIRLADRVEVVGDPALLIAAGTPEDWGVALIAGTGSAAWAKARDGRTARAGGWGPLVGDEGSAYSVVLAALRAVGAATDGRGPATILADRLPARMGLDRPQALIAALHGGGWDRARLAGLAPVVLEAAGEGDAVAESILRHSAAELGRAVKAVCRQLKLNRAPFPLALAGGLLLASADYRQRVLDCLARLSLRPQPVRFVEEPAEGAVRLAFESLHHPKDATPSS